MESTLAVSDLATNERPATNRSVFRRLAKMLGLSDRTAEDRLTGRVGPMAGMETMAFACALESRPDLIERLITKIRKTLYSQPIDYEVARNQADHADAVEDLIQGDFEHKERLAILTAPDVRKRLTTMEREQASNEMCRRAIQEKYRPLLDGAV